MGNTSKNQINISIQQQLPVVVLQLVCLLVVLIIPVWWIFFPIDSMIGRRKMIPQRKANHGREVKDGILSLLPTRVLRVPFESHYFGGCGPLDSERKIKSNGTREGNLSFLSNVSPISPVWKVKRPGNVKVDNNLSAVR